MTGKTSTTGADIYTDGTRPVSDPTRAPDGTALEGPQAPAAPQHLDERRTEEMRQAHLAQVRELEEKHKREADEAAVRADRSRTDACLKVYLDSTPGDSPGDLKFKGDIQDLRLELLGGNSDKECSWYLERAAEYQKTRAEEVRAEGDGAETLPQVRRPGGGQDGMFDMMTFMRNLGSEVGRMGTDFELDQATGSPEIDYVKELPKKATWITARMRQLEAQAKSPHARVVPFPIRALDNEMADIRLAETYGTDVATHRQPTYRRDLLVPFFRPNLLLQTLGVPMPMISNDQTLPNISASLTATWLAENAQIADAGITIGNVTTSPKRLGVRDDLSWMLLVGGDAQLGIQPIVTMEMARAVAQAKERAVYTGTGANNQPRGLSNTTGVIAHAFAGAHPTFKELLAFATEVAEEDIPVEAGAHVFTPRIQQDLSTILTFAAGASITSVPLFRAIGASMDDLGLYGSMFGRLADGRLAGVTTNLPTNLGGGNDEHLWLFGVWSWVICWDYAVAFLTIDDLSQAVTGQTRITMNSYHDVSVRLPKAFVRTDYNPNA